MLDLVRVHLKLVRDQTLRKFCSMADRYGIPNVLGRHTLDCGVKTNGTQSNTQSNSSIAVSSISKHQSNRVICLILFDCLSLISTGLFF